MNMNMTTEDVKGLKKIMTLTGRRLSRRQH